MHREDGRWSDRHGESETSELRSCPPVRQTPAVGPSTSPSQTGGTWLGLPGQTIAAPAKTTAPIIETEREVLYATIITDCHLYSYTIQAVH